MLPGSGEKLHVRSSAVVVDSVPRPGVVELEGGHLGPTVAAIHVGEPTLPATAQVVDVGDALVVPGPLDLHFHGAGGHVVPPRGDVAAIDDVLLRAARSSSWRHAALPPPAYGWVATLPVPGDDLHLPPLDAAVAAVGAAARAITAAREAHGTGCVGIRIEGLFLNPTRAGVWPPERFLPPAPEHLDRLHDAAHDGGTPLLIVDVAPEAARGPSVADAFITRARELGIITALAHTDATWEQARAAIDAGVTLATHAWNAMRPVAHRDPGVVAAALVDERVTCELICDGVHLHPATIALSTRASGPARWAVVSDASPFAGCAPGDYDWAGTTVRHDGVALRDDAGRLAGSASLAWASRTPLRLAGVTELDAALALGAIPRRVLAPDRSVGLQVGDPAWIVPLRIASPERED